MITIKEAATLLGRSVDSVRQFTRAGKLAATKISGKLYFSPDDVLRLKESFRTTSSGISHVSEDFGHWFAGFADGEGSFVLSVGLRPKFFPQATFTLSLRDDDVSTLELIQSSLKIGEIYERGSRERNRQGYISNPRATYQIHNRDETAILVELFRRFPLRSKKSRDFEIWAEAVDLRNSGEWRGRWTAAKQLVADRMIELRNQLTSGRAYQRHV